MRTEPGPIRMMRLQFTSVDASGETTPASGDWYSVRCVFRFTFGSTSRYEERVTLWRAGDFASAIVLAEAEAGDYALDCAGEYIGLAQVYALPETPGHGAEVFSLMRDSHLAPAEYLD